MDRFDLDHAKVDSFAQQMMDILNKAAVALMTSIGHQTGLFDLMAELSPSTSRQIASAAELNERYVREWLGSLVTARIVDYDPTGKTYSLPREHAVWLTRASGVDNLASQAQYIPALAAVEEEILECFRSGGGVPYASFPRIQRLISDQTRLRNDDSLLDKVLPLLPGVVERLKAGIDVADVGCGSGHAINLMASTFPNSHFTGLDISREDIEEAREEVDRLGLSNARFDLVDAATMDMTRPYDLITSFDAIHLQAQPRVVLRNIATALQREGIFLMVDFAASSKLEENLDHPLAPFMYTLSCMHCMTVSLAQHGEGLGAMWGEQEAIQMLKDAGFNSIDVKRIKADIFHNYYIATFKRP